MRKFLTVVKRETIRQMKSWKIIIISAVMLALILVIIPITLFSTHISPGYGVLSAPYDVNGTTYLKVLVIDNTGNPVSVSGNVTYLYYNNNTTVFISNFKSVSSSPISIDTGIRFNYTAGPPMGVFIFHISNVEIYPITFYDVSDGISVSFSEIISPSNSSMPGIAILAYCFNGKVPGDMSLFINNSFSGHPDSNGFLRAYGKGDVAIVYKNSKFILTKLVSPSIKQIVTPDVIITSLSSSLISIFVPIAAIIAGYDSLAKEKVSGALEIIISKPLRRETVYWGKVLGAFLPIFFYFIIISLIYPLFAMYYGVSFTITEIISIMVAVSFLTFIFIILEGISGFFGKSLSTPLIWGIVIWIFFSMIYSIISLVIIMLSGLNFTSMDALRVENMIGLGNPVSLAGYIVRSSMQNSALLIYGISAPEIIIASATWVIFAVLLFIYFSRKYE